MPSEPSKRSLGTADLLALFGIGALVIAAGAVDWRLGVGVLGLAALTASIIEVRRELRHIKEG